MTATWEVVHRSADGEHVGYLAPDDDGLVVPMTLVGTPAAEPLPAAAAAALLTGQGLALLARRWWCRLPSPLPRGLTDAAAPAPDWPWQAVLLVEVSPQQVRVRPEMPAPEELGSQAALPFPAGGLLRW